MPESLMSGVAGPEHLRFDHHAKEPFHHPIFSVVKWYRIGLTIRSPVLVVVMAEQQF
jgi:hypothetical protein